MSIIKVMDSNLSNKIAAGEVVEKLMNVVKELVENSIDARSTEIKIDLIESGIKEIKVTDNGIGMEKEDVINCLARHATSKIYDDDDLFNINTLGFRGEALPSIASVSKMEIISSTGDVGTRIIVEGGIEKDILPSEARCGTTVIVKNIFYNTPARLKYLKSLYSELANIIEYVDKMALSFPSIKFVLTNDDKVLLNTDGSSNLLKVINNIYGVAVASKMIAIKNENDDYQIEGFISYPEINKGIRTSITVLVNGRVIRNNEINKSILEAYHTYLPKDRYPIVVLKIEVDPSIIDINIHPTKMDIKFSKLDSLRELIYNMIATRLDKINLIPSFEEIVVDKPIPLINNKVDFVEPVYEKQVVYEEIKMDFEVKEPEEVKPKEKFIMIEPLTLVHGTYIVGENELGMFLIDQHAANERINYEYYLEEMGSDKKQITDLLIPIKIELSKVEYLKLKENMNILTEMSITYEEFGENTIIIRSHPCYFKKGYEEESLKRMIELVVNTGAFDKKKFIESAAITLACKMSIKANEHISIEEMRELITRLRDTSNPFTCPHGRPTIISFTKYDLEKMFKRAM